MAIPVGLQGASGLGAVNSISSYNPKDHGREGDVGLLVYNRSSELPRPRLTPFLNPTYGLNMVQSGAFSGTPLEVHDGTDSVLWTGSNISGGKVTFDSTEAQGIWPTAGTKSIKVDSPATGNTWQIDKGSAQDLSNYIAVTLRIWIDKDWTVGDSVSLYGWDTATSQIVGNEILLENYMSEFSFGVEQVVTIPLEDLGLVGDSITSLRFAQVSSAGKAAKFFLDRIRLEESGDSVEFKTSHTAGMRYDAYKLSLTIATAGTSVLANGAGMLPVSYNKLLGLARLSNGIEIRSIVGGSISFSIVIKDISDLLQYGFTIKSSGSDGVSTFMVLELAFEIPVVISGPTNLNYISIRINDDLTSLLKFTSTLVGTEVLE